MKKKCIATFIFRTENISYKKKCAVFSMFCAVHIGQHPTLDSPLEWGRDFAQFFNYNTNGFVFCVCGVNVLWLTYTFFRRIGCIIGT